MELKTLLKRARRGLREDGRLYVAAVSSLTVAFLCLAAALLGMANLDLLAERMGRTHHMSVYLKEQAQAADVQHLVEALRGLPSLVSVETLSPTQARQQFLLDAEPGSDLSALPVEAFPASVEIEFAPHVTAERIEEVAVKVRAFDSVVDEVDTYSSWFERLGSLLSAGRMASGLLALLVMVCVVAVVANTIRLAVANRRDEIEMLRMCGATDGFIRGPFLLEGALQGFFSAVLSVLLLVAAFLALRAPIDAALAPIAGTRVAFLPPLFVVGLVLSGSVLGAVGSMVSVRRYLRV